MEGELEERKQEEDSWEGIQELEREFRNWMNSWIHPALWGARGRKRNEEEREDEWAKQRKEKLYDNEEKNTIWELIGYNEMMVWEDKIWGMIRCTTKCRVG